MRITEKPSKLVQLLGKSSLPHSRVEPINEVIWENNKTKREKLRSDCMKHEVWPISGTFQDIWANKLINTLFFFPWSQLEPSFLCFAVESILGFRYERSFSCFFIFLADLTRWIFHLPFFLRIFPFIYKAAKILFCDVIMFYVQITPKTKLRILSY